MIEISKPDTAKTEALMTLRPLLAGALALVAVARPLQAQTTDERLTELEQLVQELRALHDLPTDPVEVPVELVGNEHVRWGYPGGTCAFLIKEHYVTCHNDETLVPDWVTYHLTRENLDGDAVRRNNFRPDPELPSGQRAELVDYRHSGFDRGHMAPAAAFKRSVTAMSETFFLSNMAPQRPNLNRRIWSRLEAQVRTLAETHGSIWVFTGSLYLDDAGNPADPVQFIGPNNVAVATHFYKVILCEHATGTIELFAFMMENDLDPLPGQPRDYVTSVDAIEALTQLNFFTALPEAEENRLEQITNPWPIS